MSIENVMYLALGALAAGLLALLIMPAVWRRAVRLTRRRIEAMTPMTMAEFRADKDRLRAEFAIETRRLETTIAQLRERLSSEIDDGDDRIGTLARLRQANEQQVRVIAEFEAHQTELHDRIHELEKQLADTAQRLRMNERDLGHKEGQLARMREAVSGALPAAAAEPPDLTGDYDRDVDLLSTELALERRRAAFLEAQGRAILAHLDDSPAGSPETVAVIAELRRALSGAPAAPGRPTEDELVVAEARIAHAESRLKQLLEQSAATGRQVERPGRMLAEQLSIEARAETLRSDIAAVEQRIADEWGSERADADALRRQLGIVADDVFGLLAEMQNAEEESQESLFERVTRFSEPAPADPEPPADPDAAAAEPERPRAPKRVRAETEDALQGGS